MRRSRQQKPGYRMTSLIEFAAENVDKLIQRVTGLKPMPGWFQVWTLSAEHDTSANVLYVVGIVALSVLSFAVARRICRWCMRLRA